MLKLLGKSQLDQVKLEVLIYILIILKIIDLNFQMI